MGARVIASGHTLRARVYAAGTDPFKGYSREIRGIALGRFGYDLDDASSYPTASLYAIPRRRDEVRIYVTHKKEILKQMGVYFLPNISSEDERKDVVKKLMNRLDMDGGFKGWQDEEKIDKQKTMAGCDAQLKLPGGAVFSIVAYAEAQKERTEWIEFMFNGQHMGTWLGAPREHKSIKLPYK